VPAQLSAFLQDEPFSQRISSLVGIGRAMW
jgi:hypothetical protein